MATAAMLRELALALPGTVEKPHFDRIAYRVRRIFVTVAADGETANIWFTPDEQQMKCAVYPDAFRPFDNRFGERGWTRMILAELRKPELRAALEMAHAHAVAKEGRGRQ